MKETPPRTKQTIRLVDDAPDQAAPAGGDPTAATPAPPAAAANEPVDDGKVRLVVALQPRHHDYLCQRAASFGHTPEMHLEAILREFRSYYDKHRPDIANLPAAQPGMPAMALPR
jgi:hypothetical protein